MRSLVLFLRASYRAFRRLLWITLLISQVLIKILKIEGQMQIYDQLLFISLNFKDQNHLESNQSNFHQDCFSHCVLLYLIPFEEDASDFLIFWSTHMSQIGERKKIEILRWPSEIAC